jgi:hypothetical protein
MRFTLLINSPCAATNSTSSSVIDMVYLSMGNACVRPCLSERETIQLLKQKTTTITTPL